MYRTRYRKAVKSVNNTETGPAQGEQNLKQGFGSWLPIVVRQPNLHLVAPHQFPVGPTSPMVAQRRHVVLFLSLGTLFGSHWRPLQGSYDQGLDHFSCKIASCPLTEANGVRIMVDTDLGDEWVLFVSEMLQTFLSFSENIASSHGACLVKW